MEAPASARSTSADDRGALPGVRLKIPCADEREFLERFAPRYVASGVFVPTDRVRPIGARIHLKIELRNGRLGASGEALVTGHGDDARRPGMTLRLTRLDPGGVQFELSPAARSGLAATPVPGPARTPVPAADLAESLFGADLPGPEELGAAAPLQVRTSQVKLRLRETSPGTAADLDPGGEGDLLPADGGEPAAPGRRLPSRRVLAAVAAALVAAALVAVGAAALARRGGEAREAAFVEEIRRADALVLRGGLAGPGDSALDHLVAARDLLPGDPRAASRSHLLAEKLEELGARAAARGDLREAAADWRAALRADPERPGARRGLAELEARGGHPAPR